MKCRYCPRTLRTAESKARGYGLVCGRKLGLIPPPMPRHARPTPVKPATTPDAHPDQTAIPLEPQMSSPEPDQARALPQIATACPTCNAAPGDLCTSHGGTRPRRHDVHQARTTAWNRTRTTKEN
ncbi:zinc finger domain-containing protein [Streptomyces spiralis]